MLHIPVRSVRERVVAVGGNDERALGRLVDDLPDQRDLLRREVAEPVLARVAGHERRRAARAARAPGSTRRRPGTGCGAPCPPGSAASGRTSGSSAAAAKKQAPGSMNISTRKIISLP